MTPREPEPGAILTAIFLILIGLCMAFVGGCGVVGCAFVLYELSIPDGELEPWGVVLLIASALFGGLGIVCVEHGIRRRLKRGSEDVEEGGDP